jgi:3-hydroxyacyl-[acyl-carrier-protein] dehydratase
VAKYPIFAVKFNLLDKIETLSETRICALKQVSLAEEYLGDHFPTFPVLPGVMMLEALTQAAGWIVHHRTDFKHSMVVLKEARNVKYGQFVPPGQALRVEVELLRHEGNSATFKASGSVAGQQALAARLELTCFNLADRQPELAALDRKLIEHTRQRYDALRASGAELLPAAS